MAITVEAEFLLYKVLLNKYRDASRFLLDHCYRDGTADGVTVYAFINKCTDAEEEFQKALEDAY